MIDHAKIYIRSGDGGDGIVAFRREKYVPQGGPAGGDGGHGGDIVLRVDPRINTLVAFSKRIHFKADHGEKGGQSNRTGASAEALIIPVPPGTVVRDAASGAILADLLHPDQTFIAAKGGRGGRGNSRFANSVNQAPRIADKGEPGVEQWLVLELRLIADIGIIGVPNAGKSTLLSVISNARPKIADYPFTTLEPNLGVVIVDDRDLVVADIPGLIEGAHQGVGLGHSFLRHVQRTRLLVHLLDGSASDPVADYFQINAELTLYDVDLGKRPQIVVVNKIDLPEAQARWEQIAPVLQARGIHALAISAAAHMGVDALIYRMFQEFERLPAIAPATEHVMEEGEMPVYGLSAAPDEAPFTIVRVSDDEYRVTGAKIERAADRTYWEYDQALQRFQNLLEAIGVFDALRHAGVKEGDTVYIGEHELEWSD